MKYTIILLDMLCLMLLQLNAAFAQNSTVSAKDFLAHIDSLRAAKKNDKSVMLSILRNLRDEPLDVFYKRADSLNITNPKLIISDSLLQELKEKDKGLPYHFLSRADNLYSSNPERLDEVAILMFVGLMRYDYYLGVNPGYAPNGEGWVSTNSFKQTEKLRVDLYLQNNIEKYKAILKFAIQYCSEHNYEFYKKPKEILMFNKVMQPYKNLLNELETNQVNLTAKWAQIKKANLDPEKLKNEAFAKEQQKQSNKALFNETMQIAKMYANLEELWAKIEEERKKPDSTLLKQYVRAFIALKSKKDSSFMKFRLYKQPTQENEDLTNDTVKIFVRNGYPEIKLQDTSSKEAIYSYYDAVRSINTMKYRVAKLNNTLTKYIQDYNWPEVTKVTVFEKLKYTQNYFNDGYDQTKDLYLTKSEINLIYPFIPRINWIGSKIGLTIL